MNALSLVLTLPVTVAVALAAHALVSRTVKAVLWSASPLSAREAQPFSYERGVYGSTDAEMRQVVVTVAASGVLIWLGALGRGWVFALGLLVWCLALGLDLRHWQRAAVSLNALWMQRGFWQPVKRIPLADVAEVSIEERTVDGFTLRHGRGNTACRLVVRLHDQHVLPLPKTDASGLEQVEAVANQVRQRLSQISPQRSAARGEQTPPAERMPRPVAGMRDTPLTPSIPSRSVSAAPRVVPRGAAPMTAASAVPDNEAELQRALQRLRQGSRQAAGKRPNR